MIAKGNLHGAGARLARYLVTGKKGERAELAELRGFASTDIGAAFLDVEIQAQGTQAEKPFFHAYVRLAAGEALGRKQWRYVADRIEKQLGFAGQPRAVAFHHLPAGGETHMHIAWSRIDLEAMRALDPGLFKLKLKEISRVLEDELGLMRVSSDRAPDNRTLAPGRNEFEQARRLGTDLKAIRNTIRECWEQSDSGKSFAAALDARGLILARGDKRDFVVIDHAGGDHALSKRITGAPAAEIRARLADIDRRQLPSVDQAKIMQPRAQPVSKPEIAPTSKRGIGEYPVAANNAPAAIRTRPIVAPEPETAVTTENDTSHPSAEFLGEARAAAAPATVEMRERAAASIDPGQETPASTARARSGAEAADSDHGRERGRERCDPRHRRNGAGDRGTRNSRKVVRGVESGRGGGDSTRA
jgi:Relaxase/Mobilisation nuclease domain